MARSLGVFAFVLLWPLPSLAQTPFVVAPSGASPTGLYASSDTELLAIADAVIVGRVSALAAGSDVDTDFLYTYVTIDVEQVLKGWIFERQIVVKQLGGEVDGVGLAIGGQARFVQGEEVLLMLSIRPRDSTLMTTGLALGKWHIDAGPLGRVASRGDLPGDARSLETFAARLRGLAGPTALRPSSKLIVTVPKESARATAVAAGFALMDSRWDEADNGTSVFVDIQSSGQPGLAGGGTTEILGAMAAWSSAGGSIRLARGVGRSARCSSQAEIDGRISFTFGDPCGEVGAAFASIGGIDYVAGPGNDVVVNGRTFHKATQGIVITANNAGATHTLTTSACFETLMTHELGHAIGFNHSTDPLAIMFPGYYGTNCNATVGADDTAGLKQIYPVNAMTPPSPPPPPPHGIPRPTPTPIPTLSAPSNLVARASGSNVTLTWTAPATGSTPTTYILEAGSAPGLANLANFSTGTTATTFSTTGVYPGTYYVRVRAATTAGASAASAEAILVVGADGPCTGAPAAPSGLRVLYVSGTTVSLVWNGAAGSPTSYMVQAGSVPGGSNLANSDLGSVAMSLTATGVRTGTYYVRVLARNACGTGPASNEITFLVTGASEPSPMLCSSEGSIRSVEAVQPVTIEFANTSGQERVLFWIDYNGKRVQYQRLQPGQTASQNTYLTHPWLVTDSSNSCQGIYLPVPGGVQITLR